jgi:hypothetical protein
MVSNGMLIQSDKARALVTVGLYSSLLLLCCSHAHATRIYKSIDAEGNVTYSATPPAEAVQTETMQVTTEHDAGSGTAHDAIVDEIRATAAQLEKDRKQREQARDLVRAKEEKADAAEPESAPPPIIRYYPVYPMGFLQRQHSHPHRHPRTHQRSPHVPPDSDQK